jgi:hypothetical protein
MAILRWINGLLGELEKIEMQKLAQFKRTWLAGILSFVAVAFTAKAGSAGDPYWYAVQVSATVSTSPAKINFTWPADSSATGYTVSRKAVNSSSWSQVATLAGNASSWSDSTVSVGAAYEYSFAKTTSAGYSGTGYIYAGVNAPLVESRGRVLLLVDNTYASQLATELARLQQDLIGDGWTVVRRDVSRSDSASAVKNVIKAENAAAPLRSVFIFGHVPVPYSGNLYPDGHTNHVGAWAADVYYADLDGDWSDNSVYNTSAEKPWNHNIPGDGKFDPSTLPSDADLEVGRVDLANMTCFANKPQARTELDLLRQYLNKDHNFRHGLLNVPRRGTVSDSFGVPYGEAFAAAGWRNSSAYFGAANTTFTPGGQFFTTLQNSYLFAYGCGGGSFTTCNGVGGSDDFAINDAKAVFTLFLGSYFGDWDNESAFLRAPLGGSTHTLATGWSGRPEWFLHHMALGETIGFGTRLTQNNSGVYKPNYQGTRGVHIALQGDPTLRLHPVLPVSNLAGVSSGAVTTLNWSSSLDSNIQGYHVYRATSVNGPFTRVTSNLIAANTYVDSATPAGAVYMVRAIKLESSGSGAYYNASQGAFYNTGSTSNPTAPAAPSNLATAPVGTTQLRVSWTDNSSNESSFKVERKTGATGTYATINITSANATSYNDTGLTQGTQYFYRLSALNETGASATVETSGSTAVIANVTPAATYVKSDTTTSGTWKTVYGAEGQAVMGDSSNYPAYVNVTPNGSVTWNWTGSTTATRALQRIAANDRIGACWYATTSFTVDMNFTDATTHRVAFYFLDWDTGRVQTIEVLDGNSGAVLSSQTISGFSGGRYLVWDLRGNVRLRITKSGTFNAVLSGIFFDSAGTSSGNQQTTTIIPNGSSKTIRINGAAGQTFKLYSSTNLSSWTEVTTVTLAGATYDYPDSGAGTKYYKAVPQ